MSLLWFLTAAANVAGFLIYTEVKLKEGFDEDAQFMKDDAGVVAGALYGNKKKSELSMTVPLVLSKLPFQKAVVMVKLNHLKTNYGVKISWRGIQ